MIKWNISYCSKSKGTTRSPLKPPKNYFYQLTPFTQVVCFQKTLRIHSIQKLLVTLRINIIFF